MAYISDTELGQLSAIPADVLAEIDNATKSAEREAGTSEINGYLASRYKVPLTTPGPDVKQKNADITAYRLMSRHGYSPVSSDEDFRIRYEDAIAWLKDVARGLVTLDLAVTAPAPIRFATATSQEPRGW